MVSSARFMPYRDQKHGNSRHSFDEADTPIKTLDFRPDQYDPVLLPQHHEGSWT